MSKDITDRYKLLESVARRESSREEDIQDFAETTMNELLAWYGYGDKAIRHVDHCNVAGQNLSRDETDPVVRSKTRFLCSVSETSDEVHPDLGRLISESDRSGIQKRSPSSSASSQRHKDQIARDFSSHSLDSAHSLVAAKHRRPDSVNSLTSTDSTESNLLASTKMQTREPDFMQHQSRPPPPPPAMTKVNKLCDWCRQVPPNISLADSVDGLNQLSFCSEICLNHYKMNLFCTETRQYLQQIQNSNDASDVAVSTSDNKILITPELWMAEKKESKRTRFNENRTEIHPDDSCHLLDSERDNDACRQSDCGSNIDTSNGMEFIENMDQKKNKRKKDEKVHLSSEISSETNFEFGKCTARGTSLEVFDNNGVPGAEDRFSDGENGRRGKRFKASASKESLSPASYSGVASNLKKCLENPDGLSVSAKDSGVYFSPCSSRTRGRPGHMKHDVFPMGHQTASSDLSADPTQFRRSSDASNSVERSTKSDAPTVNCHSSRQGKPNTPLFPSSPLYGSTASLPANSLFSPHGMPPLMHFLGPTLNPQFVGTGATVPPFLYPFLGFPSLLSMPGGGGTVGGGIAGGGLGGGLGGGGVQVPPGIPVPPPVTNPWSNLLPPNTLMIPYPVLLPLPIPIPIPFPVPTKCGQQRSASETVEACSNHQSESGKTAPTEDLRERPGDLRLPPKNQDKSDSFLTHTIVCTCCRKASIPGHPHDPHSRSTFCSPCRNEGNAHLTSNFIDNPNVPTLLSSAAEVQASQNLAIDFSMARGDSKTSLRSPSLQGTTPLATASSVTVKTEPLDLATSGENNNLSSSSPSSSSSLMMKSSCELQSLPPSLPYLARRSLILDAPSIAKEKPVHSDKHFTDAATSSKKFMYCKRRYPSLHIKTK